MLRQRGDTIIEVLLAITVFALVVTGVIAIMNQGVNASQRSLEVTLVKQQIDAQAEALRAAQQDYLAGNKTGAWQSIKTLSDSTVPSAGSTCPAFSAYPASVFAMNGRTATYIAGNNNVTIRTMDQASVPPYAQVTYSPTGTPTVYGLWIERQTVSGSGNMPRAFDFVIHACWYGPGLRVPMTLQTTVRLYDSN